MEKRWSAAGALLEPGKQCASQQSGHAPTWFSRKRRGKKEGDLDGVAHLLTWSALPLTARRPKHLLVGLLAICPARCTD